MNSQVGSNLIFHVRGTSSLGSLHFSLHHSITGETLAWRHLAATSSTILTFDVEATGAMMPGVQARVWTVHEGKIVVAKCGIDIAANARRVRI